MYPKIIIPIVLVFLALLVGFGVYASFANLNPLKDSVSISSIQSSTKGSIVSRQASSSINSKAIAPQVNSTQLPNSSLITTLPVTIPEIQAAEQYKTFSTTELATFNTESNCYVATLNKVYDVTAYVAKHPGGKSILKGCGKVLDSVRHPGGSFTGEQIQGILKDFYIGELK